MTNGFKRFISAALIISVFCMSYGCAGSMPGYKVVASMDELSTQSSEMDKSRNWWKESPSRAANAFRIGFLAGFTLVLLPALAVGVATLPPYHEDLSIRQISEFAAANAMDEKQWVAYHDSRGGGDYYIFAWPDRRNRSDDNWNKTLVVSYTNKAEKRVYREAWLVDKSPDGVSFIAWKSPILAKKGDDLVYIPDEQLKGKAEDGGIDGWNVLFTGPDGKETKKDMKEIPVEFRSYCQATGGKMATLKECNGDGKSIAEVTRVASEPSTNKPAIQDLKPTN